MSVTNRGANNTPVFPDEGTPLQVTRWSGQRAFITVGGASGRVELPAGAEVIEIASTQDCYAAFGDVTVDAVAAIATDASRLFMAGVQVVPVPLDSSGDPFTYIAAIQVTTPGILQVEEVG